MQFYKMYILAIVCVLFTLGCETDALTIGTLTKPARIKDFPYIAAIIENGKLVCGGSIISSSHILTAAHCIYGVSFSKLKVRVGSTRYNEGGQLIKVDYFVWHPEYNTGTDDCDIAIINLAEEIRFGKSVQPVDLMPKNYVEDGTSALVVGWGSKYDNGPMVEVLQKLELPYIASIVCKKYYGITTITLSMICAGYVDGGAGICGGDSGGPLVVDGQQLGLVAWGKGCGDKGSPGVFTSVPVFRKWIKHQVGV